MYVLDILCGISKGTFDIPHKISYPYIERYVFLIFKSSYSWELISVFDVKCLCYIGGRRGQPVAPFTNMG